MAVANSFATFLETLDQGGRQATVREAPLKILVTLDKTGPTSLPDLMSKSSLSFEEFAGAVSTMKEAGLLELHGQGSAQSARLTASAEAVLKLIG